MQHSEISPSDAQVLKGIGIGTQGYSIVDRLLESRLQEFEGYLTTYAAARMRPTVHQYRGFLRGLEKCTLSREQRDVVREELRGLQAQGCVPIDLVRGFYDRFPRTES